MQHGKDQAASAMHQLEQKSSQTVSNFRDHYVSPVTDYMKRSAMDKPALVVASSLAHARLDLRS